MVEPIITIIFIIFDFFNKGLGLITLIVGSFAIALYIAQKKEYKRNIAQLIDQEIRYAENQITNSHIITKGNYYLAHKLLPTNHWYKNINLFMKDFNETKIDKISRFYSQVEYLDEIIKKISDYKNDILKETIVSNGKILAKADISIAVELHEIKNLLTAKLQLEQGHNLQIGETKDATQGYNVQQASSTHKVDIIVERKLMAEDILNEVSNKIEFIYNTPIGEKFRDISKKKWHQFL